MSLKLFLFSWSPSLFLSKISVLFDDSCLCSECWVSFFSVLFFTLLPVQRLSGILKTKSGGKKSFQVNTRTTTIVCILINRNVTKE